jgi:dynein heavy chain, axonemal
MALDLAEYKMLWRLRSTEEVFRRLDEHIVALSSMKASRYYATFQAEVSRWEKSLSRVSDTLEALLEVRCQHAKSAAEFD